ncbi:hypothetical protein WNY78_16985 [Psychroserpens sp. AS72]|uniref:hypothetical protein n=1 Tax=Psychroserpens sp. AS72 TaxID=3135775 RepID=UPI00316D123A
MKNNILLIGFLILATSGFSQTIDSLSILKKSDWQTLRWLERDTVVLLPKPKIDTNFDGLTIIQRDLKVKQNIYGERINFDSEKVKYSNNMSCPVGETVKKINTFELVNNTIIIDYQIMKWPWQNMEWKRYKRTFKIIRWSSDAIVLTRL